MAESGEQFKCPVCLRLIEASLEPKFLGCFHTCCLRCLKQLVDRDAKGQLSLRCPVCRHVTPLPSRGVSGLQPLIFLKHLLALLGGVGMASDHQQKQKQQVSVVAVPHGDVTPCCPRHNGGEMRLLCETCRKLLCQQCAREEHHGNEHSCQEVSRVLSRTRDPPHPQDVTCELFSEVTGVKHRGTVVESRLGPGQGSGRYHVTYPPVMKGHHQVVISVGGTPCLGVPFSVTARSPAENLSTPVRFLGRVQRAWGVAALRTRGEVAVVEYSAHCVSIFSPKGVKRHSFGMQGAAPGCFDQPSDLCVDKMGNIVVADSWNHRVQKFSPEGVFLAQVGSEGTGKLQFSCPTGIAYNGINDRFYVVDRSSRVQALNSDLSYHVEFGREGNGEGQFNTPWGIACDTSNTQNSGGNGDNSRILVADSGNNRIQVFTSEGEFLWVFGRRGQGRGELGWPAGIAVDAEGVIYITEGDNLRVSVFASNGKFMTSFGRRGKPPCGFGALRGVAVDGSGMVYVCDKDSHVVQVF